MKVLPMFLNGAWTESADGATREILNPANNETIAIVTDGSERDAEIAIGHARRSFDEGPWPQMRAQERAMYLFRLADLIDRNAEEFATLETRNNGKPLREDPLVRQTIARLVTQAEVARCLGLRFVAESMKGGAAPTCEASEYKLYATELSKRVADASMDVAGPGSQLRLRTEDAPMDGRAESTYRYTVIDTIGGGSSEVQKNIIARRKLGLPKNF